MSGDEHRSGLRDAIADGLHSVDLGHDEHGYVIGRFSALLEAVEQSLVAWLSVVSEGERGEVARALADCLAGLVFFDDDEAWRETADVALAASRRLLVPRIESDENGGTK